jgi:putative transposase
MTSTYPRWESPRGFHTARRRCLGEGLLHHSDQGSPYASDDHQKFLDAHGITCSMSRRGNCYDNAAMESWFSTPKFELGERFETRAEAKEKLFDYIEVFYNQQRRRSSLDYVSPAGYEKASRAPVATALSSCPPDRIKPKDD